MLGKEALVILEILSLLMAAKMEEPIWYVQGWVNSWIAITVARSYYHMIRGARLPSTLRPAGQGTGLVNGFGSGIGTINCEPE